MGETEIIDIVSNVGGLGVVAVFAFLLLKNYLANQQELTRTLDNHLQEQLAQARELTSALESLKNEIESHANDSHQAMRDLRDSIDRLADKIK